MPSSSLRITIACALLSALSSGAAVQASDVGFLKGIHKFTTLGSTVPENGDQNPYAIALVPASVGRLRLGDVLITNFNNDGNLQGTGSTLMQYTPGAKSPALFAQIPRDLPGCPGGVGLTTALAVLRSGKVIVGSLPSRDGTTATRGQGCLIVLDSAGKVAGTIAGPEINGPWGNMAVVDEGERATLFISNAGFGVAAPGQAPLHDATVLRLRLTVPQSGPPQVTKKTVIAGGFGQQADKDVFLIGPTGLALGKDGTLYVSDALANRIGAIPDAMTRGDSAGTGREVAKDGLMRRPLALATAPNGNLLVTNGLNGQVVEIDPVSGAQLYALWIDANKAQSPPGNGDLFGIAMTPAGDGFYYVKDEVNTLLLAH